MILVPEEYVVCKFFQYGGRAKKVIGTNKYQASCPHCREGNSWNKKQRFFYIPDKNLIYCHNCGYSKPTFKWLLDITGMSPRDLIKDLEDNKYDILQQDKFSTQSERIETPSLPEDSINLFDSTQVEYYKSNAVVSVALKYIKDRKLDIAVNKPKALYVSLTDRVHKNRLVLPFYDDDGKVLFYQSRTLLQSDKMAKYISKQNGEKSLFNFDRIDSNSDYVFIFEGPINSFFCKNGVAVGGIQEKSYVLFTPKQKEQINKLDFKKRIWVLDSQWIDSASQNKTKKLLEMNETVFIWPKELGKKFKDFNDIIIRSKSGIEIPNEYILNNSQNGLKAMVSLSGCR
jgi:hypothetical protein